MDGWDALRAAVESRDHASLSQILCRELKVEEKDVLQMMHSLVPSEHEAADDRTDNRLGQQKVSHQDYKRSGVETADTTPTGASSVTDDTDCDTDVDPDFDVVKAEPRAPSLDSTAAPSTPRARSLGHEGSFASVASFEAEREEVVDDVAECWDFEDHKKLLGHFTHPSFGNARILIEMQQYSANAGWWTVQGQTMELRILQEGDSVRISEIDGLTRLEGKVDASTGVYVGHVIQEGVRGGMFELHPHCKAQRHIIGPILSQIGGKKIRFESASKDVGLRPPQVSFTKAVSWKTDFKPERPVLVRIAECKDVVVVHIGPDSQEKEVIRLPKEGLVTFGDVKRALAERFGHEEASTVKFVMRSSGTLAHHLETDRLRTGKVFATGLNPSLL